ncbi:hypothetical protein KY326_04125 [Candidatus Woesearchaeota archaeon]|nr:hypothetical protein [Candidatus Woesearchaeota archaeon]
MAAKPIYRIRNIRRRPKDKLVNGVLERMDGGGATTFMIPIASDPGFKLNDEVVVMKWSIGSPIGAKKRYATLLGRARK